MEICNNGDFATYLYENDGKLEEARIRDVVHQIAVGMKALRERGMVHLNLKSANILLSNTEKGVITPEIAVFVLARLLDTQNLASTYCGTFQ